jgi:hypothetical protein
MAEFEDIAKKQFFKNIQTYLPALKALTDDSYMNYWADDILTILWS